MPVFVLIILSLVLGDLGSWRIASRWVKRHHGGRLLRTLCHVFFSLQTAYILIVIGSVAAGSTSVRRGFEWIPRWAQAAFYIWHLIVMPLSLLMWAAIGLANVGRRLMHHRQATAVVQTAAEDSESNLSRRELLVASVAMVPPLMTMGTTGYGLREVSSFRLNQMTLPVRGLPDALHGFRIAHVSDLHVGRWSTDDFLHRVIQQTNALNADIILFTGDLIDISTVDLPKAIEVAKQWRARHGLLVIEGNHDLIESPSEFHRQIEQSGLRFLRTGATTLEHNGTPLQILGVPWSREAARMEQDFADTLQLRQPGTYPILLAHHPHVFDLATAAKLPLTLSGHTHGGQIALNRTLNVGNALFRYVSGVYRHNGSALLVSNGTGNWFPLRIGAPAEIIDLTLVPEM